MRSLMGPANAAEAADANVRKPWNNPAWAVDPPRAMMRYGAVGSNWNTVMNTVKLNPNMMRKRGVNSRSDIDARRV